ncbi:transcriptional regulator [Dinghuibacter silviterrae]|uniref:Uncharacterized protein n=1 Tax=Dinghuibacter silviterrae TaxID=1539049 RepID=A0A4R8DY51_9BACT|nr:transcriptional regulator [Dinghuibacter silviterrae]TDX02141.1 hypothetical protein EDB95_3191 [Dinghuibacter silviterrae]
METHILPKDIRLCCFAADSFPDGIVAAFQRLHSSIPNQDGRRVFGLSWPDGKGSMIYKAAAEERYPGEAEQYGAEAYTLAKGEYIGLDVDNFMDNVTLIGSAFRQLVDAPGVHPHTMGVEEYLSGTTVRCMVPMAIS